MVADAGEYLRINLMLQLHPRKIYLQHYSKGVVFLGTVIKPYRIYVANRTKNNFYQAIENQNKLIRDHEPEKDEKFEFLQSMNSYLDISIPDMQISLSGSKNGKILPTGYLEGR